MDLFTAAETGDLAQVTLFVEQGADKNEIGGVFRETCLAVASEKGHLEVVRYLVEQGADMGKADTLGYTPLIFASWKGHLEVVQYLLEQGADRDRGTKYGITPLHVAAVNGHLEITKILMVYGADLNARTDGSYLPIELGANEEIRQAIRDEPRRRMDHGHKRATEQDRHPNVAAEQEQEEYAGDAEIDEGSEPSDEEDGDD